MNSYFCSVGKDLANEIEGRPNPLLTGEYSINSESKIFKFTTTSEQKVRDVIGKSNTAKGSGYDNIYSLLILQNFLPQHEKAATFF